MGGVVFSTFTSLRPLPAPHYFPVTSEMWSVDLNITRWKPEWGQGERGTGGSRRKERRKQKARHSAPFTALESFLCDVGVGSPNHGGTVEG